MTRLRVSALWLGTVLSVGCARAPNEAPLEEVLQQLVEQTEPERAMRGIYTSGFERSLFRECGSKSTGWVNWRAAQSDWSKVKAALDGSQQGAVYVEMVAVRKGPGRYGHLSRYRYEVTPISVSSAKPAAPTECEQ
jgi:hypothetical protein